MKQVTMDNVLTEEIFLLKLQGRPYTFYADEFLNETEINNFCLSAAAISCGQEEFAPNSVQKNVKNDVFASNLTF
jgi:hypothetical protein